MIYQEHSLLAVKLCSKHSLRQNKNNNTLNHYGIYCTLLLHYEWLPEFPMMSSDFIYNIYTRTCICITAYTYKCIHKH